MIEEGVIMCMSNVSVIVPFLNESDCIIDFCNHIENIAKKLPCKLEVIFVDDGSTDDTVSKIKGFIFKYCDKVKVIKLSKNYGSHAATRAGLTHVSNEICTFMAADMQEPDDMIEKAYQTICQGFDIVNIEKENIEVSRASRLFSLWYAWLMRKYAVKSYGTGGINNIMFNSKITKYLNTHVESNSSLNLQILDTGFKSTTLKMKYKKREAGKSKWTLAKKIKLLIDSFVAFSFMPIRLVSIIGIIMFILGALFGCIIIINKLINPEGPIQGYSTIASLLAIGFGITNISLGIIAEYLWRTYDAARGRPAFIISDIVDVVNEDNNEVNNEQNT